MDDRCPDVLAGQRQGLVRLAAQLGVERGVVQRVGEFGRQAGLRQDGLEEGPGAAIPAIGPIVLVPTISSTSRNQAIFVDHATGPSLPSCTVLAEEDRSG